jgi:hypothetical protein
MRGFTAHRIAAAAAALLITALVAAPVLAWQGEGGTKTCIPSAYGYVHSRFNDVGQITAPGSSITYLYTYTDGQWHTKQTNGVYGGGPWAAYGDPYLDLANTWAQCSNIG